MAAAVVADAVECLLKSKLTMRRRICLWHERNSIDLRMSPGPLMHNNCRRDASTGSQAIEMHLAAFIQAAQDDSPTTGVWADVAMLSVATRRNASPEASELAKRAIDKAWEQPQRRLRLMDAAARQQSLFGRADHCVESG